MTVMQIYCKRGKEGSRGEGKERIEEGKREREIKKKEGK